MLLLATSTRIRGGSKVLAIAKDRFPRQDANVVGGFLLPNFYENFELEKGIVNEALKNQLFEIVNSIKL